VDTKGSIVFQTRVVIATGDITLTATGDIVIRQVGSGHSYVQSVEAKITASAGGVITIEDGAFLQSATGKVSNQPPLLRLDPQDPHKPIVPSDTRQTLTGWIGGYPAVYPLDHLEQGDNFIFTIEWNDGIVTKNDPRQPGQRIGAGDRVTLLVGEDGTATWTIAKGSGTGPIFFELTRVYPIKYLITVSGGVTAKVSVANDGDIVLSDSRQVEGKNLDLNNTNSETSTRVAGEQFGSTEKAAEFVQPAAPESTGMNVGAPEIRTTPVQQVTRFEESQARGETAVENVRNLYIVKVGPSGEEGEPHALPDDALADLAGLFEKFKQEGLPNGLYRIYLKEIGFPRRKLVEFYKSGQSFGDPVREPGPGSNPIQDEGSDVLSKLEFIAGAEPRRDASRTGEPQPAPKNVPSWPPAAAPRIREAPTGESEPLTVPSPMPGTEEEFTVSGRDRGFMGEEDSASDSESPKRLMHPLVGAAVAALSGLGAHAALDRWSGSVDKALEDSGEKSFSRAARLRRRCQR